MDWPKAIAAIVSLLEKWGKVIAAFFAGKNIGADQVRDKAAKEADEAQEAQDESDQKFEHDRRDPDVRDRVRDAIREANDRPD